MRIAKMSVPCHPFLLWGRVGSRDGVSGWMDRGLWGGSLRSCWEGWFKEKHLLQDRGFLTEKKRLCGQREYDLICGRGQETTENVWTKGCKVPAGARVKILYPDLSVLYNTIRGSSSGKSRLSLWRLLEKFASAAVFRFFRKKTKTNFPLGSVPEGHTGADWAQRLHRGCWREQGCPDTDPAASCFLGRESSSWGPGWSPMGSLDAQEERGTTSLFHTDPESLLCAMDLKGTSWAQARPGRCSVAGKRAPAFSDLKSKPRSKLLP